MATYTTLEEVRKYLSLASQNVDNDEQVLGIIKQASRAIDRYTRRSFAPTSETRFYDYRDPQMVWLDKDLLSLTSLKYNNGACTMASGVMWLGTGENWNYPPYDRIVLNTGIGSQLNYSTTQQRAIEVTGLWGYHENYSGAWVNTGTSLAASMAASDTIMQFAGAGSFGTAASDENGYAPRIAIGNLLRVDNEFFDATATTNSGTSAATVQPYRNGTTAASHASGTTIYKFEPEPDIEWTTKRLSTWILGQTFAPYQEKTVNYAMGSISIPTTWPPECKDKMDRFMKRTIAVLPRGKA